MRAHVGRAPSIAQSRAIRRDGRHDFACGDARRRAPTAGSRVARRRRDEYSLGLASAADSNARIDRMNRPTSRP
ncbi:hypothetical protein [Lysobacter antibioticus]|uniref:hypothetical protein n=1 Tax=Lysobacter antibioticus TaxID=84531 RepID=UPI001C9570A4|nr:hypothetical protein [Lysobacter antibioticus]